MLIALLFSNPLEFALVAVALVASLTIHEWAHAIVGDRLGDPTARLQGRVTINPLAHLDPLGTLMILFIGFGWGKPVPFDPYNLRHPKRDSALIAVAGPASNLLLATLLAVVLRFFPVGDLIGAALAVTIATNVGLAIFNLIPIHPLDGGKILIGLAPKNVAHEWDELLHQYGTIILLFLILPLNNGRSAVSALISPIVAAIVRFLV